jgi:hypothetical protein
MKCQETLSIWLRQTNPKSRRIDDVLSAKNQKALADKPRGLMFLRNN